MSINPDHISPAAIERVAEALMKNDARYSFCEWRHVGKKTQDAFRSDALAAIIAYETALRMESNQ
ncbi:MAG TPA: hypothetical protein VMP68_31615 [Candidatus Eisenbacteria bacterium]|nr:hypothetical protein [Candidatus Eisenbacteria bacterium]